MVRGNERRDRVAKGGQGKDIRNANAASELEESAPHPVAPEAQAPSVREAGAASTTASMVEPPSPPFVRTSTGNYIARFGNNRLVKFSQPVVIVPDCGSIFARMNGINRRPNTSRGMGAAAPVEVRRPGPTSPSMDKLYPGMAQTFRQYYRNLKKEATMRSNDNSWIPVFINDFTDGGNNDPMGLTVDDVTEWIRQLPETFNQNVIARIRYHCEELMRSRSRAQAATTCATGIETSATGDDDQNDVSMMSCSSSSESEEDEEPRSSSRKKSKTA